MKKFNQQSARAVSLYLALLVLTGILSVGLGLSAILVSQLKIIKGMSDSVIAFFAADSGIEKMLQDGSCPQASYSGTLGQSSYYVEVVACDKNARSKDCLYKHDVFCPELQASSSCLGSFLCAKAVGIYNPTGVRRAIEIVR